jgi:hypothetical protein
VAGEPTAGRVAVLVAEPGADPVQVSDVAHQWSALRRTPVVTAHPDGSGDGSDPATVVGHQLAAGREVVIVPLMLVASPAYEQLVELGRTLGVAVTSVLAPAQELTDRIVALARGQVVLPDVSVSA